MMNKKKKIATLTFHLAHNYGAMLQAYALQQAISKLGGDCEIIDYRFPYINQCFGVMSHRDFCQEVGLWRGTLRYLKRRFRGYYRCMSPLRRRFDAFMRRLKLSKTVYFEKTQLRSADYDYVVTGSDQIWNPSLTDGPAEEYFGQCFDLERTRLIAYAASCGKAELPPEHAEQMVSWLRSYSALAIREKSLSSSLRREYGLNTVSVLDPVFLLSAEDWGRLAKLARIQIDEPYLLLYAFQVDTPIYDMARNIAAEKKLRLVTIQYDYDESLTDMLQLTDCDPLDFLSLVSRADFICTSSFHGNAFAIIFEKDFYCVGHPLYSQRNLDMLSELGLCHRFVSGYAEAQSSSDIDYNACRDSLQQKVSVAKRFLKENLDLR